MGSIYTLETGDRERVVAHCDPAFTDERGIITNIIDVPIKHVAIITSAAGSRRGHHYHPAQGQYIYVISGEIRSMSVPVGPDGKPVIYSEAPPNKLGTGGGNYKPTRLYSIATGVLQGPVPQPFLTFDVESLIGKSNELFVVRTGDGDNARSEIAGFLPVPHGVVHR